MRAARVWLWAALSGALAVAVFCGLAALLVDRDREAALRRARAAQAEDARLALWRLDALISGWLARENARPPYEFAQRVAGGAPKPWFRGLVIVDAGSLVSSPELEGESWLASLEHGALCAALDQAEAAAPSSEGFADEERDAELAQRALDAREFQARQMANSRTQSLNRAPVEGSGLYQALWWEGELLLLRCAPAGQLQVLVVDAPRLQAQLSAAAEDQLPGATIARAGAEVAPTRLASLPLELRVPDVVTPAGITTATAAALGFGGGLGLLALAALAILLRALLQLSERRGAFVSAVTHELRTPLTSFKLYTELLRSSKDEAKRERYVATLHREAERLGHLVENVLSFSRLEGGVPAAREAIAAGALIERLRPSLESIAESGQRPLDIALDAAAAGAEVRTHAEAVERILVNLVNNACKYGVNDAQPTITLRVEADSKRLQLWVLDRGPGVAPADRGRVFEPFFKSAFEAAESKPGVGLGLALSRRLARELGGELELRDHPEGAGGAFLVTLPRAVS